MNLLCIKYIHFYIFIFIGHCNKDHQGEILTHVLFSVSAIEMHAKACKRNLMSRKIFDFKDDTAGTVTDIGRCYIQTKAEYNMENV